MGDPYQILGLARSARDEEIKKAYRRLARETHPDTHGGDARAADRFKQATAAYELLSNPQKRKAFDAGLIDEAGAPMGRSGPRGNRPRRKMDPKAFRTRGADVTYSLQITLEEALGGIRKRISTTNGNRLDVTIPAGSHDGKTLRLRGQGLPGFAGGEAGDALVEIKIKPPKNMGAQDGDFHTDVKVPLETAVLGGKLRVETIDGPVHATVPPGSNTGTTLRLRGKGMTKATGRGDHFVHLTVTLPTPPDPTLTAALQKWAKQRRKS
ncbi:MAG: DnaJ C-terminal domain-containing protein [Magnetospiraceae bacterium]